MTERPILFSGSMVRAILAGTKTQTRRLVTDQTSQGNWKASQLDLMTAWVDPGPSPAGNPGPYLKSKPQAFALHSRGFTRDEGIVDRLYPRWFRGDRLWVRERWRIVGWHEGEPLFIEYAAGGSGEPRDNDWPDEDTDIRLREQCDEDCTAAGLTLNSSEEYSWPDDQPAPTRWRPSIHMPRAVARLTLEITDVRAQRLQEISEADAKAEGIPPAGGVIEANISAPHTNVFQALWDSINGKRAAWASNPWVWALTFRRLE